MSPGSLAGDWRVEPLTADHDVSSFDSGEQEVDDYLRNEALRAQEADGARTRVLVRAGDGARRVVGYFTLVGCQILRNEIPRRDRSRDLRRLVPATLLAQLGVSRECQGSGLGTKLLLQAFRFALKGADAVGSHVLVLDALSDRARSWYEVRFGLRRLKDDANPNRLFILMREVRELGIEPAGGD